MNWVKVEEAFLVSLICVFFVLGKYVFAFGNLGAVMSSSVA